MRTLTDHVVNPANDRLTITALDEPGHGGACHAYDIIGGEALPTLIRFQNGPIKQARTRERMARGVEGTHTV